MVSQVNLPAAQLQVGMGISLNNIQDIRALYGMVSLCLHTFTFSVHDLPLSFSTHVLLLPQECGLLRYYFACLDDVGSPQLDTHRLRCAIAPPASIGPRPRGAHHGREPRRGGPPLLDIYIYMQNAIQGFSDHAGVQAQQWHSTGTQFPKQP
jgi:hypothetical protein